MAPLRLLWVTDETPDRHGGGGNVRQFHLLRRIARKAEVDLLIAGRLADPELREHLHRVNEVEVPSTPPGGRRLRRLIAPLPGLAPTDVAMAAPVAARLGSRLAELGAYDVVQVEHEWLGGLVRHRGGGAWAITLHNLLAVRLEQAAARADPWRGARLASAAANARRYEDFLARSYQRVIAVSDEDARRIGRGAVVVPNGVDLADFPLTELPAEPRLIITATWSWPPNAEGAVWAVRHLLPKVRARVPSAELVLVGRQPPAALGDLAGQEGVSVHFDVPAILPHLQRARVALVPLWVGSGTRIKALEAMAAGRPLVGTPIGLEGLGLVDGSTAHICSTAEDMAERVVRLLADDEHARSMARAARRLVEERFGWDGVSERYWEAITALV